MIIFSEILLNVKYWFHIGQNNKVFLKFSCVKLPFEWDRFILESKDC